MTLSSHVFVVLRTSTLAIVCVLTSVFFPVSRLLPYVKGNIGFVFTNEDLKDIRDLIQANKVSSPLDMCALLSICGSDSVI